MKNKCTPIKPITQVAKKVAKTIGTPKCSNKVRVTCPSAPKIAQYFKALGGTLNTKANPTAGDGCEKHIIE